MRSFSNTVFQWGTLAALTVMALGCEPTPSDKDFKAAVQQSAAYAEKGGALSPPWATCTTPDLPGECTKIVQSDFNAFGGVVCGKDLKCHFAPGAGKCTEDAESVWDCSAMYEWKCLSDDNAKSLAAGNPCVEPKCAFVFTNADGTQNKSVGIANFPPRAKTAAGYPTAFTAGKGMCQCTAELCTNGVYDKSATCTPAGAKTEACGNGDENCDGATDEENATGCEKFWVDNDGDKFGGGSSKCFCAAGGGFEVKQGGDCKDDDTAVNPSKAETCDAKDNNCSGVTDEENATGCSKFFKDVDEDAFGIDENKCLCAAAKPFAASKNMDCDDGKKEINPAVAESCATQGVDDNCDGKTDEENAATCSKFWTDADGDSYGVEPSKCLCAAAAPLSATVTGECDDGKKEINPKAVESCATKGVDDNCNSQIDEEGATGCKDFYLDADADGFGISTKKCLCAAAGQYTATQAGDCDDTKKLVNPNGVEECNGADDNCKDGADEGATCSTCMTAENVDVGAQNVSESTAVKISVNTVGASDKAKVVMDWFCTEANFTFLKALGAEFAVRPKADVGKTVYVKFIPDKTKTPIGSFQLMQSMVDKCGPDKDSDGDGVKETVTNAICLNTAPMILGFAGTGKNDVQVTLDGKATKSGANPTGQLVGTLLVWAAVQ